MFFSLASKLPFITSDNSDKKLLKVFVLGAVFYVMLHYYLFSGKRMEILDKFKNYIYYVMPIDLALAYFLCKTSIVEDKTKENNEENGDMSHEQQAEVMKNIEDMRRMQFMRQQAMMAQTKTSQNSPFVKKDEAKSSSSDKQHKNAQDGRQNEQHNKQNKQDEQYDEENIQHVEKAQQKNKKTVKKESDTSFPVYNGEDEE
jgi:hypothetical protein